jgi:hypothetical protein
LFIVVCCVFFTALKQAERGSLHAACCASDLETVRELMQEFDADALAMEPDAVRAPPPPHALLPLRLRCFDRSDVSWQSGQLPLHLAVQAKEPKPEVVQLLIDASAQCAAAKDKVRVSLGLFGKRMEDVLTDFWRDLQRAMLPLHCAAANPACRTEILSVLYDLHSRAIMEPDQVPNGMGVWCVCM